MTAKKRFGPYGNPPTEGTWTAWYDDELSQWQILNDGETEVVATGIGSEGDARLMAGAQELLNAVSILRNDLECNGEILGTDSKRIELLEAALRAAGEETGG